MRIRVQRARVVRANVAERRRDVLIGELLREATELVAKSKYKRRR
jgi:hypothetical protein